MAQKMRVMFFLALMFLVVHGTASAAEEVTYKTVKLEIDGGAARTIMTYLTTVEELLESEGVEVDSKDVMNVSLEDKLSIAMPTRIKIQHGNYINLVLNGQEEQYKVLPDAKVGHVVAELKEKREIEYFYKDGFLNENLKPDQTIALYTSDTKEEKEIELIPYMWDAVYTEERPDGEQIVIREGEYGERTVTYEVMYIGDEEVARTQTSEVVTKEPVNKIVEIGLGEAATVPTATVANIQPEASADTNGALPLEVINAIMAREMAAQEALAAVNGDNEPSDIAMDTVVPTETAAVQETQPSRILAPQQLFGTMMTPYGMIEYVNVMVLEASAYSPEQEGMSDTTATGVKAEHGVVAVDPETIPLGTTVYIEGYGIAIAADTGSAIQEDMIDLCFDTVEECMVFGRKDVTVYIMK